MNSILQVGYYVGVMGLIVWKRKWTLLRVLIPYGLVMAFVIVGMTVIPDWWSHWYHQYCLRTHGSLFVVEANYHPNLEAFYEPHCMICLEPFQAQDSIMELKCGCQLIYHKECLVPWLLQEMTCPVCKTSMIDLSKTI